ncbi:MAG: carbamoyltransferase [Pirellula sp.]|jgi:carbamoyltransferase
MRVLGISPLDKDATVSFFEHGRIVFACGEERLSRTKLQDGFPHRALAMGLKWTGWTIPSIDRVAYAFFDAKQESALIRESQRLDHEFQDSESLLDICRERNTLFRRESNLDSAITIPGIPNREAEYMVKKPWHKRLGYWWATRFPAGEKRTHRKWFQDWIDRAIEEHEHWNEVLLTALRDLGLEKKLVRFHHHDTHAANAYYSSGLEEALVLVLDGYGAGCAGGVYSATDQGLKCLHRYRFPNSLGIFYEQVTSGLGFKPSRHEGKIVGLAAYGDPSLIAPYLRQRFDLDKGDIRIRAGQNGFVCRALATRFAKRDVAAAYQYTLEQVACESVAHWLQRTGHRHVVMSGGVHANVKLNQRIQEVPGVDGVFIYPNMGDGGCATGAAMLAYGTEHLSSRSLHDAYLGPEYSDSEIQAAIEEAGLTYQRYDQVEERIASLLANNAIVARFAGRMEYGPRALGNRSILYPARDPKVNQWLNEQLGRTEFMPFAPAVLAEEAPNLFHGVRHNSLKTAEFMTITFDCTDRMKQHSPAAVHVDGTARPQLVSESSNPSFYAILKHYQSLTNIPVLINTSFNMHEEPIVCSPQDAVRAFLLGNIDYLAAGNFLVKHPKAREHKAQHAALANASAD